MASTVADLDAILTDVKREYHHGEVVVIGHAEVEGTILYVFDFYSDDPITEGRKFRQRRFRVVTPEGTVCGGGIESEFGVERLA
jgi:hypothetical protein